MVHSLNSYKCDCASYVSDVAEPVSDSSQADLSSQSQAPVDVTPINVKMFRCVRDQVIQFIEENVGIKLQHEDIVAAHELKPGRNDSVAPLVVRFAFTAVKQDVMFGYRQRRIYHKKIYFNDQLTVLNGKISYQARTLVKNGALHGTWTRLGKMFIKETQTSRPVWIQKLQELPSR